MAFGKRFAEYFFHVERLDSWLSLCNRQDIAHDVYILPVRTLLTVKSISIVDKHFIGFFYTYAVADVSSCQLSYLRLPLFHLLTQ